MKNTKSYKSANLEGQKLVQRFESTKGQYQLDYKLFQSTENTPENVTSLEKFTQSFKE